MAAAGNNKNSQAAMNQTFFLTNVVPQVPTEKSQNFSKCMQVLLFLQDKLFSIYAKF